MDIGRVSFFVRVTIQCLNCCLFLRWAADYTFKIQQSFLNNILTFICVILISPENWDAMSGNFNVMPLVLSTGSGYGELGIKCYAWKTKACQTDILWNCYNLLDTHSPAISHIAEALQTRLNFALVPKCWVASCTF